MSTRFRAICTIHCPPGSRPVPAISTVRLPISITNKTWYRISPSSVTTSTVKKSIPAIAPRCALMNVPHDIPLDGAGSMPFSCNIRWIVLRPIL
jgi:hypothetical protein